MKKYLVSLAIAMFGLGVATPAHAIMIDPYLTYEMSDSDTEKANGTVMGARVAWDMLGLWVGADIGTGSLKGADTDETYTLTDMGLSVGYKFPVLVRAYATYILNAKAEVSGAELTGTGTKLGVGFTGLPFITVNYEIIQRTFTKMDGNDLTSDSVVDSNALSVSYTLSF